MLRKILTYSALSLIACGGFFASIGDETGFLEIGGSNVYASVANNPTPPATTDTPCEGINCAGRLFNTVFQLTTIVVTPAIILASWLLSPDWTSGDLFGLRDTMYKLWVTISNIIYFVYAILLIMIALGTIFGNEKFGYKVMLPRLALGILMVPFTWVFVQWTISVSTYVTASVVSIPQDILSNSTQGQSILQYKIPSDVYITSKDLNNLVDGTTPSTIDCKVSTGSCITIGEIVRQSGGTYGNLLIYAYGVFKVQDIQSTPGILNTITSIGQLVNQLVIGVLMFLVFGILVIALIFMLMMRVIKLWVYAIFSPLFTLHFVAGKDLLGDQLDDFSIKEFIGLCFVPAVVGLALSFGLVVITAIMAPTGGSLQRGCTGNTCTLPLFGIPDNKIVTTIEDLPDNKQITKTKVTIGGFSFNFAGDAHDKGTGILSAEDGKNGLSALGGLLGTIIIDIIALIFIWVAFMAAKNVSKAVGKAVEPFEAMGKKIGELGASLPKYTPIPGLGLSMKGLEKGVDMTSAAYMDARNRASEERLGQLIPSVMKDRVTTDELRSMSDGIAGLSNKEKIKDSLQPFANVMAAGKVNPGQLTLMRERMDQLVVKVKGFGIDTSDKFAEELRRKGIGSDITEASKVARLFFNESKSDTEKTEAATILGRSIGSTSTASNGSTSGATGKIRLNISGVSIDVDKEATAQDLKNAINAQKAAFGKSKITKNDLEVILAQHNNAEWEKKDFVDIVYGAIDSELKPSGTSGTENP